MGQAIFILGNRTMNNISIVFEMDNATLFEWEETEQAIESLKREFSEHKANDNESQVELILVQTGDDIDAENLKTRILKHCPALNDCASLVSLGVPGGRYYDLKNKGIEHATGDIIMLADSDAPVQPGWLQAMAAPFSDPDMMVANGHTYLAYESFMGRVYALYWFFPLRENDEKKALKRALNANNLAFRKAWIKNNPFPYSPGFKLSCGLLWQKIRRENIPFTRVDAYSAHAAPRGLYFFFWRSFTAGRDQDRRFAFHKTDNQVRRFCHAFSRFCTRTWEALVRTLTLHKEVGLFTWQAPFAFLTWTVFSLVFLVGQLSHAFSKSERDETIPEAIQVS